MTGPGLDGGVVGVQIVDAGTGKVLYARNADTRLLPASNAKLFTAAAALELLGESYTWQTRVVSQQKPDAAGVVSGDMWLVGGGDASLLSKDLDNLAAQIKASGVTRIAGQVYGDNSLFTDGPYGFGWEWDDFSDEEFPQISALTVDDGDAPVMFAAGAAPGEPVQLDAMGAVSVSSMQAVTEAVGSPDDLNVSPVVEVVPVMRPLGRRAPQPFPLAVPVPTPTRRTLSVAVSGSLPVGAKVQRNVPQDNPSQYAANALSDTLALLDIVDRRVLNSSRFGQGFGSLYRPAQSSMHTAPLDATMVLATHTSAPLSVYVTHMLKESDNLYAECLVRTVGVAAANKEGPPGPPSLGGGSAKAQGVSAAPLLGGRETQTASQTILPPTLGGRGGLSAGGTFQAGLSAEQAAFKTLGVDMTGVTLIDGCGVGRRNYVTARAVCQLLVGMRHSPHWKTFYNALPVAGMDGTLKSRMKNTPAQGNCHAKTGTLGAVRCLSGYVTGRGGRVYAFSLLLNNFPGTAHQAGAVQDAVVELLAGQG